MPFALCGGARLRRRSVTARLRGTRYGVIGGGRESSRLALPGGLGISAGRLPPHCAPKFWFMASTLISRTIRSSVYAPVGAVGIPTVGPLSGPMESAGGRPAGHEPIMSQRYLLAEPTVLIGLSTPKPCTCIGVTSSRRYRSYVIVRVRTTRWLSLCERAPRDRSQSRCTCGASGVSSTPVERLEAASTWYRRVPRLASPERAPVGCLARTGGPGAARPTHTERMSAGLHVYG